MNPRARPPFRRRPRPLAASLLAMSLLAVLATWFAGVAASGQDTDLQGKLAAQEKARSLAQQLVTSVLDLQLKQLAENGLQQQEIYRDIRQMRDRVGQLADQEMSEVVRLLAAAAPSDAAQRQARLLAVQQAVREVVAQLLAERQQLQRRLKSAQLAAEARRLLDRQSATLQAAAAAAELPAGSREQRALSVAEDQQLVGVLYFQFVSLLEEVRTWTGPMGAAAARGLALLRTAAIEGELARAAQTLRAGEFAAARGSQRRVIRALQALLEQIDAARGMVSGDRAEMLRLVDELIRRQDTLKEQTLTEDLRRPQTRDPLETAQRQVYRQLGELSEAVAATPALDDALLEQAKQAALESVDGVFSENADAAAAAQSQVIGSLAQLRQQLASSMGQERSEKSSDELLAEERQLTTLWQAMIETAKQQQQAGQAVTTRPALSADQELQVSAALETAAAQPLPADIQARLQTAAAATAAAAQAASAAAVSQPPADSSLAAAQHAVGQATQAVADARSAVAVRLADTKRHRLAVEVGELARAAESLERAAAAQREASRQLQDAQTRSRIEPDRAARLAAQQPQVAAVAEKITEGVARTAPQAAQQLHGVQARTQQARQALDAAVAEPQNVDALKQADKEITQAAATLERAAQRIRSRQAELADQLARVAGQQLTQISPLRGEAEQTLAAIRKQEDPQRTLRRALQHIDEAKDSQLQAAGQASLAQAQRRQREIVALAEQQRAAEQAANRYRQGRSNSPLEAVAAQQAVAKSAAALADALNLPADQQLAEPLRRVARDADRAARSSLLGTPRESQAAQQRAGQAVRQAQEKSAALAATAKALPAGQPDLAAQQQVGQQLGEAQQLTQSSDLPALQFDLPLKKIEQASQAAAAALAALQAGQAAAAPQQAALQHLYAAEVALRAVLEQWQQQHAATRQQRAADAAALAQRAADIAPAAAGALRQAAQQAAQPTPTPAAERPDERTTLEPPAAADAAGDEAAAKSTTAAGSQVGLRPKQHAWERAVANLVAREQAVRRDFDVAATLADLAREQQAARDEIRRQAEILQQPSAATPADKPAPDKPPPEGPLPQAAKLAAAEALQQASRRFADAQRATGQGAVEISGQQEVVNQPIREGLQRASELSSATAKDESAQAGDAGAADGGSKQNKDGPSPADDIKGVKLSPEQGEGRPGDGQGNADSPAQSEAAGGSPNSPESGGPPQQGQGGSTPAEAGQLGTGMVPQSADVTAQQIAGAQATQAANEALAQSGQAAGQAGQPAQQPGAASGAQPSTNNQSTADLPPGVQPKQGRDDPAAKDASDRRVAARRLESEPWFAKLPPALQQAVKARSRQSAPRGYEERLRRYFQSGN